MSVLWVCYFWLFTFVVLGSLVGRVVMYFAAPGKVSVLEVCESFLGPLVACALYGHIHHVALGQYYLWPVTAIILPVVSVIGLRSSKTSELFRKVGRPKAICILACSAALTVPAYVALLEYCVDGAWQNMAVNHQ